MTLNGARGLHPRIKDRFDLTIECVRRHYVGQPSPLTAVIERYRDFFDLFADFGGFIQFFLLEDRVAPDGTIHFFHPFEEFGRTSPTPKGVEAYKSYRELALRFVEARNRRILNWCDANLRPASP